jgi:hypothetical protein
MVNYRSPVNQYCLNDRLFLIVILRSRDEQGDSYFNGSCDLNFLRMR